MNREEEKEQWKDIEGYEGLYQVSDRGRIKSFNYMNTGKTGYIRPGKHRLGYLQIRLAKNGVRKTYYLHRLVAEAFIPNPDNLPEVNHKDEDKTNNQVENLEWCNHRYNVCYGTAIKRTSEKNFNGKKTIPVCQYTLEGKLVKIWSSATEAERQTDFNQAHICDCCNGKRKKHKGFIWSYQISSQSP